jgi:hypothetical protein
MIWACAETPKRAAKAILVSLGRFMAVCRCVAKLSSPHAKVNQI